MSLDFERLASMLNVRAETLEKAASVLTRVGLVLAVAYVCASTLSAYLMSGLLTQSMAAYSRTNQRSAKSATMSFASAGDNYRDILRSIRDRNLFNSTGEYPDEKSPDASDGQAKKTSTFDINAACNKPTMNVELVGTIYLASADSIATVQEQGYSETDVYREGDVIIGTENAQIVRIERNRVVLNNNGVKECLELATATKKESGGGFPDVAPATPPDGNPIGQAPEPTAAGGNDCLLEEKYVQDELGPGFGTIIQKARLVPNTTDNAMNGFKIFAIDSSSLLGKTGLKNGDIITQVNDVSLKQPEQGFALYQAFQDEKEVRIQLLRGGTAPMTITCRIK